MLYKKSTKMTCIQNKQKQLPKMLSKKGVLKNFAKFTGKYLYQSLFFNKVACLGQNKQNTQNIEKARN